MTRVMRVNALGAPFKIATAPVAFAGWALPSYVFNFYELAVHQTKILPLHQNLYHRPGSVSIVFPNVVSRAHARFVLQTWILDSEWRGCRALRT